MKNKCYTIILLMILVSGCNKILEEKSDKRLSIPTTINDFHALLNTAGILNTNYVAAGEVSSDDYFISDTDFRALNYESDRRLYMWEPDYVSRPYSSAGDEWYNCYQSIYICNSVLYGLDENNHTGAEADIIKGTALTFRAARYLDGVQTWAPAYNKETAGTDLGMVLRLDPDMNIPSIRSSVQETYDLIIGDLTEAARLLPIKQPGVTLPSRAAAYGLLARAYLFMGDYDRALQSAEAALVYNSHVIDFNTLDPNSNFPIPAVNEVSAEVVFWCSMFYTDQLSQSVSKIAPELYGLYDNDDLRRTIYFKKNADGTHSFKGTHFGYFGLMKSITTSELFLTVAECNVRLQKLPQAADALNQLLVNRWKKDEFIPYTFTDQEFALKTILDERRKELIMRGLRWSDLKRLNSDGYEITLTRTFEDKIITLPPNDHRYAIAISEEVIYNSGIQQNPRK